MSQQFRSHPIYALLTLLLLLLAALLVWGMRDGIAPGDLLFFVVALAAAGYFAISLTTSIRLTESELHIHRPLRLWENRSAQQREASVTHAPSGFQIAFRQLISVERTGRLLPVLTILYHPVQADGLIDVTHIAQSTLPLVIHQDELQARLEEVVPVHHVSGPE
ncbi:MAG: hypothetical protein KDE19_16285 [Caldilineaceae bacterium]|nr:hypothetical protein [Caldilineaceae bacterium]